MSDRMHAWGQSAFQKDQMGALCVYRPKNLMGVDGLNAGFTTRIGGDTPPPYDSISFNWTRCASTADVERSYAQLAKALGVSVDDMVAVQCQHGTEVHHAARADGGRGCRSLESAPATDGIVTDERGLVLITLHADCMPIYFYDARNHAIGLCHSGWRGVVGGMANALVAAMQRDFGSRAEDLLCAIGPHIGPCCFEVDDPVVQRFERLSADPKIIYPLHGDKATIDMQRTVEGELLKLGIAKEHIDRASLCTACHRETFFSYRRDKGVTGSMAAFMVLR